MSSEMEIVRALRSQKQADEDGVMCTVSRQACDDAADILEFVFSQFQMHSPDMGGKHSYRFRNGGWPMMHLRGPNIENAIRNVLSEIKLEEKQSR